MAKVASEYEVESIFIEKLGEMGYDFIPMSNYNDIVNNFRTQLCKVNAENLMEAKPSSPEFFSGWRITRFMSPPKFFESNGSSTWTTVRRST